MKKYLFLLVCVLFAHSFYALSYAGNVNNNSNTEQKIPHRKIYGFFLVNLDFGNQQYGIGSLYADNPAEAELLYPFGNQEGLFAGAVANNVYYGCSYIYKSTGPVPSDLISVDLSTGERKNIGPWTEDINFKVNDMAYNGYDEKMYAVGFQYGTSSLFTVDLETGKLTKVVDLQKTASAIAANFFGKMYCTCMDGGLYEINTEDGSMTLVCQTEMDSPVANLGLEFDHTDGSLYWACNSYTKDKGQFYYLGRFDMKADPVTFTLAGEIGSPSSYAQLLGLHVPYVLAGEEAPAAPTNISVTPYDNGELKAKIKWTNPTKNFGGENLEDITMITIKRGDDHVGTISTKELGAELEFEDTTIPASGEYKYIIYASNHKGDGEKAYISQYIGMDVPSPVKNLKVVVEEGCKTTSLSWEKSEGGAHGSYVDPATITYKIVRYPDEVVVAENLKETSYKDESIRRLAAYHYKVFAVNEIGETEAYSNSIIAGPAMDIPYNETFAEINAISNQWTAFDANNDNYTWMFSTGAGQYTFGDATTAAEYYINPMFTPQDITSDADEWIVTPPINFEAGKQYSLKFDYRSVTDENLTVTIGNSNSPEAQETIEELTLEAIPEQSTDFVAKEILLPVSYSDEVRAIGFHLTTPYPSTMYSFIQIANMEISEYKAVDETEAQDRIAVRVVDGSIMIYGEFNVAEIYSADGMKVASTTENIVPAGTIDKGMYIVRVVKDNKAQTFKVMMK